MPKPRTIAHLLEMLEVVQEAKKSVAERQRLLRRRLYPAHAGNYLEGGQQHALYRIAAFQEHPVSKDYSLTITEFGYTQDYNSFGVTDTWHVDWYRDVQDTRFIEHVKGSGKSIDVSADIEKLAWEHTWPTLIRHSEEDQQLAIEHGRLDRILRAWHFRSGILHIALTNAVSQHAIACLGDTEYDVVRVSIEDRVFSLVKGGLVLRDVVLNCVVPSSSAFNIEGYGKGSNADLQQRRRNKCR
jgi:hypothetical protein